MRPEKQEKNALLCKSNIHPQYIPLLVDYSVLVTVSDCPFTRKSDQIRKSTFQNQRGGSKSLVEQFLGLVDLRGEIRTSASIGMVKKHKLPMILADLFLGQRSLAGKTEDRVSRIQVVVERAVGAEKGKRKSLRKL